MARATIDGLMYWRALQYAAKVCPGGDGATRFAHVVFQGNRMVASDGQRRHDGWLPEGSEVGPFAATRSSVKLLLVRLEYAHTISRKTNSEFLVKQDGSSVTITVGKEEIKHKLDESGVGDIPNEFHEPVDEKAPAMKLEETRIDAGMLADAIERFTTWGKDTGMVTLRGRGAKSMVRVEVRDHEENHIGTAFLLPADAPPAVLPDDEPLFRKLHPNVPDGQSVLSLVWDEKVRKNPPKPAEPVAEEGEKVEAAGEGEGGEAPSGDENPSTNGNAKEHASRKPHKKKDKPHGPRQKRRR